LGLLGPKLVDQLIQAVLVDTGLEAEVVWLNLEAVRPRLCPPFPGRAMPTS
jgi:hypothetical protein